jgi:EmrB/QacA subfamily drug resistance transporter
VNSARWSQPGSNAFVSSAGGGPSVTTLHHARAWRTPLGWCDRVERETLTASNQTKWLALALICLVQFMSVLDIAIVNVALPSIQQDLGFSQENLQWVISAYALVFGGLLLLGGRLGDRLGRRRVFFAGLLIFTVASLCAGLSWSEASLIVARGLQGLGAALLSPAALAILTATFAEGRERNIALGVWGATGGFGAAAGVLFGGILTDLLSWEWIFFVNVPVGVVALALTPVWVMESRDLRTKTFDVAGAVLITAALIVLVLGITQANQWGWGSAATWIAFGASAVLHAAFLLWERGREEPLVPMAIFRVRTVLGANVTGFILGTVLFGMFLLLTLYMQLVLGLSPLETGFGYLAVAGTAILWANVSALLVNRVGVKRVMLIGMALLSVGLLFFTQVSVDGSYWTDLFPGFLVIGLGMPFVFVPVTIAAVAGVSHDQAGLASGLINTSQQIGGALGIAVLSAIATSTTDDALAGGAATPQALVDGFTTAFWIAAAAAAVGVVAIAVFVRQSELAAHLEPAPAGAR